MSKPQTIEKLINDFWGKYIELPKEMKISSEDRKKLKAYLAHQQKWYVDLFSPRGLFSLFPTLKKTKGKQK